eukprot:scaffold228637_cov19-Tisochrysis_lutea.AAC.2
MHARLDALFWRCARAAPASLHGHLSVMLSYRSDWSLVLMCWHGCAGNTLLSASSALHPFHLHAFKVGDLWCSCAGMAVQAVLFLADQLLCTHSICMQSKLVISGVHVLAWLCRQHPPQRNTTIDAYQCFSLIDAYQCFSPSLHKQLHVLISGAHTPAQLCRQRSPQRITPFSPLHLRAVEKKEKTMRPKSGRVY